MALLRSSPASLALRTQPKVPIASRRPFSSSRAHRGYDDTVQNLRIGKHTRVIYQGFTGRVATGNAKDSLAYGTNIVGGVTPGKEGEHLGLPLLPNLRKAKEQLKPDATAVFVAAPQCGKAIEEAIEAEIGLIVSVAEHIPLHDMMRVFSILRTQSKSRLVGANAPGIISPIGSCRIGFQPLPTFAPGHIGIVAKSGTLSYETVASITRSGLGQSLCIGMGGDIIAGTNMVDALRVFESDPETAGIVLVGEVGGRAEEDAADWIVDYRKRVGEKAKPIAALVGGIVAPEGRIMGHAGAWRGPGERSAKEKYAVLEAAGATMVQHPEDFGGVMKTLLSQSGRDVGKIVGNAKKQQQQRGYHTMRRRPATAPYRQESRITSNASKEQRRGLLLGPDQAPTPLEPYLSQAGVSLSDTEAPEDAFHLGVTVDRTARSPCLAVSPSTQPSQLSQRLRHFPYDWREGPTDATIKSAIAHMQLDAAPPAARAQTTALLRALAKMYTEKEAVTLSAAVSIDTPSGNLVLHQPTLHLQFDDAAFRSCARQEAIHSLRRKHLEDPAELEAETHGIVFLTLPSPAAASSTAAQPNIGTLVNGAGLAMNTLDALAFQHSGTATNFLDTGGKATAATVKKSFELILQDPRVKVIFVNIFGGLTDGGMIAEGILLAFREVDMRGLPVVVRIRGTNEGVGQRIIAESGLGLEAFDGFAEAAGRVVELANR
ncbi:hypothetical protein LTS16_019914 [Friedmanniomyces endolithicus]|nr:hypothetical protein LTS09_012481 [Friedmanniomyces endolithicus]KAK0926182.1 hypothetical protein LTR57_004433 [Friedmanniomyces endolithicus]KAK0977193.1 hypothetical protein LTS01_013195 [Friedmanniomyces endolithicus]KAK1029221.1 hypothetical protein LTS16_019914 [Friedmanniomyces endolithicus]